MFDWKASCASGGCRGEPGGALPSLAAMIWFGVNPAECCAIHLDATFIYKPGSNFPVNLGRLGVF